MHRLGTHLCSLDGCWCKDLIFIHNKRHLPCWLLRTLQPAGEDQRVLAVPGVRFQQGEHARGDSYTSHFLCCGLTPLLHLQQCGLQASTVEIQTTTIQIFPVNCPVPGQLYNKLHFIPHVQASVHHVSTSLSSHFHSGILNQGPSSSQCARVPCQPIYQDALI